jgi:hypothetical protein
MKKVIYVCHPFRGDPAANAERVRRICKVLKKDCVPLAPQLMLPAYINESTERDLAIAHCLRLVAAADEVRVYGEISEGMRVEIDEARRLRIPISFVHDHNDDDPQDEAEGRQARVSDAIRPLPPASP